MKIHLNGKGILLTSVIIIGLVFISSYFSSTHLKGSLNFNDLGSYQKQKYWQYMKDCQILLSNKQFTQYQTCALNSLQKASTTQQQTAYCTDGDGGIDYLKKGKVTTDIYPNGIEDYIQTFDNGKAYLMEGACSPDNRYMYYQKNCKELGQNYNAVDGVCANQLVQFPMQVENDAGTVKSIHLNVGQTYSPSVNNFLRLDAADYTGSPALTLWNKDTKGCRLVDGWINSNISNGNYAYFLDQFMEITKKDATSIDADLYTGNMAYDACNSSSIAQKVRCLAFPKQGRFKIESAHFSRLFDNKNEYDYNNLMLNYLELGFTKLQLLFPVLNNVQPYGSHWKFPLLDTSPQAHSANGETDTAVMINGGSGYGEQKIIDSSTLLTTYANKLLNGNFYYFDFSAELHELTHMLLYPTALLKFPVDGSDSLAEGIANYVQSVGKYYPNDIDPFYATWCGKNKFNNVGFTDLDGLSYSDAFKTGKGIYNAGQCFFKRVQDTCGIGAINDMFKSELDHQYHPFNLYPNIFTTLKNSCSKPNDFNAIMDDFGFDKGWLNKASPMAVPSVVIQTPACNL